MTELHIRAFGRPAPQGSKSRGPAGQLREQSPYLPAWRRAVKVGALQALVQADIPPAGRPVFPAGTPVHVRVTFLFGAEQGEPTTPPDIDKLLRSTFDAITDAKIWADDAQVIRIHDAEKMRAGDLVPGAVITLSDRPFANHMLLNSRESAPMDRYRLTLVNLDAPESDPADGVLVEVTGTAPLLAMMLPAVEQALTGDTAPPAAPAAGQNGDRRKRRTKAEMEAARAAGAAPATSRPERPAEAPAAPPVSSGAGAEASFNPFVKS